MKEINNSKSTLYPDRFPVPNINQHKIFLDLNNNIVPGMKIKYRKWIVNPHPSEDDKSFKKWRSFSQEINSIKFCVENFNENLSEFEIVFGFNSIALLKASFKASFVYSLCDYVNWEEKLPHPQIIYL